MEEKLCPLHEDDIISVCFFEGCNQHLLCKECIKSHPDTHSSNTKNIISLMRKDDWIKLNENLRNSQMAQLKSLYNEKEAFLSWNQEKLRSMIDEIIESLRTRLSKWINKLTSSADMKVKPDNTESLSKMKDTIDRLADIDFRNGDIYNQLEKAKLFNETILPESMELCKQYQSVFDGDRIQIDQRKLDARKLEVLKLIRSISLKDFTVKKSETLTQDKTRPLDKSNEEAKLNSEGQSDQLTGLDRDYQQKIETLTVTNEKLQDKIFKLKTGLDSLVEVKLNLQTELEALKTAHRELIENCPKLGLLGGDSLIIQNKDVENIRAWIPNPSSLNESRKLKLNLLYRGTRDGFTCDAFYKQTDNISPTMSFIKSKMYGRVFGGYTTLKWRLYSGYSKDYQAFLFSLTHGEKYPIGNPSYAMHGRKGFILSFGSDNDLQIAEGCDKTPFASYTIFPYNYQCPKFKTPDPEAQAYLAGSHCFSVEEIEVYQVVWS